MENKLRNPPNLSDVSQLGRTKVDKWESVECSTCSLIPLLMVNTPCTRLEEPLWFSQIGQQQKRVWRNLYTKLILTIEVRLARWGEVVHSFSRLKVCKQWVVDRLITNVRGALVDGSAWQGGLGKNGFNLIFWIGNFHMIETVWKVKISSFLYPIPFRNICKE